MSDKSSGMVLIVGTQKVTTMVIEEEACKAGLMASFAKTGNEGFSLAIDKDPEIIVVDFSLNGRTGIDFVNELKISPKTHNIPVVVVNAGEVDSADQVREAGIENYLKIPFAPGELADIITRNVDGVVSAQPASNILLVEDSDTIRVITRYLLEKHGHRVTEAVNGEVAWEYLHQDKNMVDMIVTDINMPKMDGVELVSKIRAEKRFGIIPIIVATTISDKENIKLLLNLGADDYIVKPFSSEEFIARIASHLRVLQLNRDLMAANGELNSFNDTLERRVQDRTAELRQANLDAIYSLAVAAETKDDDTGNHIVRIQNYSFILAKKLGLSEAVADEISYSAIMHDVGKIAVADKILKKPGKLTSEEFDEIKKHSEKGERILPDKPFFRVAREIALYHHEKFDGSGYPKKLAGKEIPLSARIVAVADVFDALVSKRSYKPAWPAEKAFTEIIRSSGSHFDPDIVSAFVELYKSGEVGKILIRLKEE